MKSFNILFGKSDSVAMRFQCITVNEEVDYYTISSYYNVDVLSQIIFERGKMTIIGEITISAGHNG